MRPLTLAVVVAILGLSATGADAAGDRGLAPPDWLQMPSGDDVGRSYPTIAETLSIEGRAQISCTVSDLGALTECAVVSEEPAELGFGRAALSLAPSFRMKPMSLDGAPVGGGKVVIPIRFTLPTPEPEAEIDIPGAEDEAQLEAARRFIQAAGYPKVVEKAWEESVRELEYLDSGGESEAVRTDAAEAMRTASRALAGELREALARAYASVFTRAELQQFVEVMGSPSGAVLYPDEGVQAVLAMLYREFQRRLSEAAQDAFCKARTCDFRREIARVLGPSDGAPTVMIDNPSWTEAPSEDDIARAAPAVVQHLGFVGVARLNCIVTEHGLLDRCETAAEAPAGFGFGAAAISLAGYFRLSPISVSQGAEGETVAVRVAFAPAERPAPFKAPTAKSASALALARQLVETSALGDHLRQLAKYDGSAPPEGADTEVWAVLKEAIRIGAQAATAAYSEQLTSTYAALYSEEQLAGALAFERSQAGRALRAKRLEIAAVSNQVLQGLGRHLQRDAGAIFCKAHGCVTVR